MSVFERFWPWSEIARLKSELETTQWQRDMHKGHLGQYIAERDEAVRQRDGARKERGNAIVALSEQGEVLHKAHATIRDLRAQIAKFDHDGDGKPGGSKSKKKIT